MSHEYFSDREQGPRSRTRADVDGRAWAGLLSLIETTEAQGGFAEDFPELCQERPAPIAVDHWALKSAVEAEVPGIEWPPYPRNVVPDTVALMDILEFFYRHAAKPIRSPRRYHDFLDHHHLTFDKEAGQEAFRLSVNTIFARNGIALELDEGGLGRRTLSSAVESTLEEGVDDLEDTRLSELIARSETEFRDVDPERRQDALLRLWDAFERLKTIRHPDKRRGSELILAAAATSEEERVILELEMRALTKIGNDFQIRHHETSTAPLIDPLTDYLYLRMYALLQRLTRTFA